MTLQFRRGTDSDRLTITPSAGEPIWTTDTEKLYVGDGSTAGGVLAGGGGGSVDSASTQSIIDSNFGAVGADLIPALDSTYDLGSASKKWKDLHLSGNSIFLGGHKIVKDGDTIKFTDSAGATINIAAGNVASSLIDSSDVTSIVDSAYINARTDANLDSAATLNLINAAYIQANQTTYNTSDFADSAFVTSQINAISIPTLGNDFVDSGQVTNIVDATYIQSNQTTYNTSDFADSAFVTSQIEAISIPTLGNDFVDSAQVTAIIDSAYVIARSGEAGTDSATVSAIIAADVDSAYIQLRQSTVSSGATTISTFNYEADSGQTTFTGADIDGSTLTYTAGKLNVYLNGILLVDSNDYTATNGSSIVLNTAADSSDIVSVISYITQAVGTLDSAGVTNLIDATYIQANQTTYNTSDFADSAFVTSQIAAISIPTLGNDFVDSSAARGLLSGGTGVTYNSGTGEISIGQAVGITDSAVFASLQTTGNVVVGGNLQVTGTTTTVNSEDLNVTDNMIYMNAGESSGSPTASIDVGWAANVNDDGSYTHVGMFRDATDNTFKVFGNYTPEPDAAVEINTGHASFTLAPFAASTLSGEYLGFDSDVTAAGLATQTYVTTRPISTFTNDANYLDSTTVQGVINSSYIQSNQTTYNTSDFADSAFVTSQIAAISIPTLGNDFVDSGQVTNIIDATYIQSNQTTYNTSDFADSAFVTSQIAAISIPTLGNDFVDSAQVQLIVDSAYVQLRQAAAAAAGTDSATVSAIIVADVDSAYVQARQSTVSSGATTISTFNYEADSGQTTFSGADIDGSTLTYTSGKLNVYLNGILLVDSNDYTATNGSSIVLNTAADSSDIVSVISYITQSVGTLDSAGVINLIDSAYIQARQLDSAATATNALNLEGNPYTYYLDYNNFSNTPTIPTLGNDFVDSGQVTNIVNASYIQSNQTTYNTADFPDSAGVNTLISSAAGSSVLAYDANLQGFVDAFTLPTSDGSASQVLVTNGSGTLSFAAQSGGLDSALITQLIDSAYVQAREAAGGGGGGGTDSATVNTLIDAKLQVTDITDFVGADGNYGEYLKTLGNGETEWSDLATEAKQKAFAMALIFG